MTPRQLAPVWERDTCIDVLRSAVATGQFAEFRLVPDTRKHTPIDITTANAILQVYDALNPENQKNFLDKFGDHPLRLAEFAFKLIERVRSKSLIK